MSATVFDLVAPDGLWPIDVELRYDPGDPYAITLAFVGIGEHVTWSFGRDLLSNGLFQPVGDGDVKISPAVDGSGNAKAVLELSAESALAQLVAPAADVGQFLARTMQAVQPGTESEYLPIDETISAILASA